MGGDEDMAGDLRYNKIQGIPIAVTVTLNIEAIRSRPSLRPSPSHGSPHAIIPPRVVHEVERTYVSFLK
jgi:hypothetical protein